MKSPPTWAGFRRAHLDSGPTPRAAVSRRTPPGPEGSKGQVSSAGCAGGLLLSGGGPGHGRTAPYRLSERLVRVQAWKPRSPSTAATGRRRSPRSSARTTSPSRCARRWPTTGSTTPTCSPARAAAARPPAPGSWPARSTASRGRPPSPCGECQSCRDLARGGPGCIDVIEIDAASHGGVDDARDLRERAFFAPVSSRYKVYIIDEAHMVTHAGLQRPAQAGRGAAASTCKFIFATTEPDKVIGTIRSRTHHYPFRLVPPRTLLGLPRASSATRRASRSTPAALPLVVRAGAGSVRDSLSVLDQLLGGAGPDGRHLRARHRACSATPPTPCSTRSSTRSPPATAPRSSASSTR